MSPKFILVGPIDGLYHACYKIPGTKQYSSYEACELKQLAQERVDHLNFIDLIEESQEEN